MAAVSETARAGRAVRFLHPGEVVCAERGEVLETLLGSCVAVILTDPARSVGAMCHIVHAGGSARADCIERAAYAADALAAMRRLLGDRGFNPAMCEAYVFGGGNMFPDLCATAHVGERNVRAVLDALALDSVRVLHCETGGSVRRRVRWTIGREAPQIHAASALEARGAR